MEAPAPLVDPRIPQRSEVTFPEYAGKEYYPFSGNVTGSIATVANGLAIWTPNADEDLIIRGGCLTMVVTTQLAGSGVGALAIYDDDTDAIVWPLNPICGELPAGYVLCDRYRFVIPGGYRGNGPLRIAGTMAIGAGVILAQGTLWGEETT